MVALPKIWIIFRFHVNFRWSRVYGSWKGAKGARFETPQEFLWDETLWWNPEVSRTARRAKSHIPEYYNPLTQFIAHMAIIHHCIISPTMCAPSITLSCYNKHKIMERKSPLCARYSFSNNHGSGKWPPQRLNSFSWAHFRLPWLLEKDYSD